MQLARRSSPPDNALGANTRSSFRAPSRKTRIRTTPETVVAFPGHRPV